MTTATFDTLATARKLTESGLETAQAEAVTEAIRAAVTEGVAMKADLAALRADVAAMELRLTWRILGGVAVLLALATALGRLLG